MWSLVDAHVKFMNAARPNLGADELSAACSTHAAQVVNSINAMNRKDASLQGAADAMECVRVSCFDTEQKSQIVHAINSVATSAAASSEAKERTALTPQEHFSTPIPHTF